MLTFAVIVVVSGALLVGAAWGIFGKLPRRVEGFVVAIAGGSLIASAILELIDPAIQQSNLWAALGLVLAGGIVFSACDYVLDRALDSKGGVGLLAAITLDGIPENLALGVALIGAEPLEVAALAGSILLSNLPEAAGGAKSMREQGHSRWKVFSLWLGTAAILSAAAWLGHHFLTDVSDSTLSLIRAFAGGAVIASLATEVFPKAFREDSYAAGIAACIGLVLAIFLDQLG